jgi:hypothetical protein
LRVDEINKRKVQKELDKTLKESNIIENRTRAQNIPKNTPKSNIQRYTSRKK